MENHTQLFQLAQEQIIPAYRTPVRMEELVRILIVTQHTNVTVQRDTQEPIVKRVRNYAITIHFKSSYNNKRRKCLIFTRGMCIKCFVSHHLVSHEKEITTKDRTEKGELTSWALEKPGRQSKCLKLSRYDIHIRKLGINDLCLN